MAVTGTDEASRGGATTMAQWLTVLTTIDSPEKAEALARGAGEVGVAACAQVSGPVRSVYRWQGEVETAAEWQVLFKTTAARYEALEAHLRAAHDYETPEIVATPVVRGEAAYLRWIEEQTTPGPGTGAEAGATPGAGTSEGAGEAGAGAAG
jgi:periplasmic divalent cation tolerance protein